MSGTSVAFRCLLVVAMWLAAGVSSTAAQHARNVILMISDGIGFNGWEAARYYQGGLPYDNQGFQFYGMTTYMRNVQDRAGNPVNAYKTDSAGQDWVGVDQGYDPARMWTDFNYHRGKNKGDYSRFTGSAAAATAMHTGCKTYRGAVCYGVDGKELTSIAEIAAASGKATGSVTTVQLSHATPACVDAHHYNRNHYDILGREMIYDSDLDVIMGAGDGDAGSTKYVGGSDAWEDIKGDNSQGHDPDGPGANGFVYISEVAEFRALADGSMTPPNKVLGIAKVNHTLNNAYRPGKNDEIRVPTLETMTQGALRVLSRDSDGFFLMVEGGAVDWENHRNDAEAMMVEQVDFDNSVKAVMDWIEDPSNGSSWNNTLLIVTADHETGGIWGPGTLLDDGGTPSNGQHAGSHRDDTIAPTWNKIVDHGPGNMPGYQYTTGGHTNAMVPLWIKGAGADLLERMIAGNDPKADAFWDEDQGWVWNGDYVDNTALFRLMKAAQFQP